MIDMSFVARLGVLLVRPGALVATAPPFGGLYVPPQVKIGLAVILGIVMAPTVPTPDFTAGVALPLVIGREVLIGTALGLAIRALVAGAELAGQLAGFQIGFTYAGAIDPQTGARNNVIGIIYTNLTLVVLLGVNAHHAVLKALANSYTALPIGGGHVDSYMVSGVARTLGVVFILGVQLAAPVVIVLLLVELALGLLTRAAPALNIMAIGFSVRLIAGLMVLAAAISVVPGVITSAAPPMLELAARIARALR